MTCICMYLIFVYLDEVQAMYLNSNALSVISQLMLDEGVKQRYADIVPSVFKALLALSQNNGTVQANRGVYIIFTVMPY